MKTETSHTMHNASDDDSTVLVFDSGAGGLSVCREIQAVRPSATLIYAADNRYFPYGELSSETLKERVISFIGELIEQYQPNVVVIACNTASTIVLDDLRATFSTPFVGVVPAVKPAAAASKTRHIAILATTATVSRAYTHKLINHFADDCEVTLIAAQALVAAAENHILNNTPPTNAISETLEELFSGNNAESIDTIVLACTHFPLLKTEIRNQLAQRSSSIELLDSGAAIARRVDSILPPARPKTLPKPPSVHLSTHSELTQKAYQRFLLAQT